MTASSKTIADLREALFAAIADVRAGAMPLDQARAINDLARTLVDSAKVEVDYLRVTDGGQSTFIAAADDEAPLPPGITGVMRHRLLG